MLKLSSKPIVVFILMVSILLFSSFTITNTLSTKVTEPETINWQHNLKLRRSDFKASKKWVLDNSVASSYCGFGYSITDVNGDISGNIYVRFNSDKSWFNSEITDPEKVEYILKHEQLHFDICELFGRKMYKEVLKLISLNKLNQRTIERIQSKLENQYSDYQKKYDKETNHSIIISKQKKWQEKIRKELSQMKQYANYSTF